MEDDELDFQQAQPQNYPLSPVVLIQETPSAPQPAPSAFRLPSPYPTFNASWPLPNVPQGPRAFIRSSMVFRPTTRQFCPLSSATTSPRSDGHVSDASSVTPVNIPRFPNQQRKSTTQHLYPLVSTVSPTKGQPIPTVLSTQRVAFTQPSNQPQPVVGTLMDLAYDPQQQVYEARYLPQVPSPQSFFQEEPDTRLRQTLAKLERENARLRNENQESIHQLQNLTEEMQSAMNARIESLDKEFRRRLEELSTNQGTTTSQPGIGTIFLEQGFSGNGPNFNRQYRSFTKNEKLAGNRNFCEWSSAIMTEFQVLGILETLASEYGTTAQWSPQVRTR